MYVYGSIENMCLLSLNIISILVNFTKYLMAYIRCVLGNWRSGAGLEGGTGAGIPIKQ